MATSDLPLVLLLKGKVPMRDIYRKGIDNYSDRIKIVELKDLTEESYSKVEGLLLCPPTLVNVTCSLIESLPNLRVISTPSVGTDHICVEEAIKRGIKIGHTPKVIADSTADLGFGLLIASARNIIKSITKNKCEVLGVDVSDSTIGIVGLGGIGSALARRAKGFNMKILYHTRTRKDDLEKEIDAEYCHQLTDLLKQADFVVLCVPLTSDTKHLISAPELSAMKPSATLINIARGDVVDQEALFKALQTEQIRAAALDVTSPQPLPKDHPLRKLPNVIITPHIGTATKNTRIKIFNITMENLLAGLKGEPLTYQKH